MTADQKTWRLSLALTDSVELGQEKVIERELPLDAPLKQESILTFCPQRIVTNAHGPGLFLLKSVRIGGVDVLRGDVTDAWQFNPNAIGAHIEAGDVTRADKLSFEGFYTGRVPMGMGSGFSFKFMLAFTGPAVREGR